MDLIDDSDLPPEVEKRIVELAAIATDMRVEAGELPGPAELLGIVDAVALLQATGTLPLPERTRHGLRRIRVSLRAFGAAAATCTPHASSARRRPRRP